MTGFLSFAIATGLIYGRFSKPKAYLIFSDFALVAPYLDKTALMFRFVSYKENHMLTNVEVVGRTNDSDTLDVAFLKIKDKKGKKLTPAKLGDSSKMQVGDRKGKKSHTRSTVDTMYDLLVLD